MAHQTRLRPLLAVLRAAAAGLLLAAGGPSWAASPTSDEEAIAALQAAYAQAVAPGEQAEQHRELIATVLQRVKRSNATEVDLPTLAAAAIRLLERAPDRSADPAEVFKKTINDTLRTIDPYARYIDPRALANDRASATGSFGGLGVEVQPSDGVLRVVAALPGSPAARAGLAPGDLILRVDEHPLEGVPLADAIERLRGKPGTPVAVTIRRAGNGQEVTVSLTRDTIRRELLRWSFEDDVLVLRLSSFSGAVTASLSQAVADAMARAQPRAVVLDLRGNPGGLLREGVRVADAFLARGDIVSLRSGGAPIQRVWRADEQELLPGVPMVVLLDSRSASASELVADALQFHGRATVLGQRSYGKGTVQTTYSLGEGQGALKLTTSTYIGPSGASVQGGGVWPDVELVAPAAAAAAPAREPQLPALAEARPERVRDRVEIESCSRDRPADPGLACALAFLHAPSRAAFLAGAPR